MHTGLKQTEQFKKPKICLSIRKNVKIRAILHNWEMADGIEVGFSLNSSPKEAENTPVSPLTKLLLFPRYPT